MTKKRLTTAKKNCFVCFYFKLGEFTEEDFKRCDEYWFDAQNCPNWKPVNVRIEARGGFKKIIWVGVN